MPFLAICRSLPPFNISCVILISKSKNWTANELAEQKMINYHIRGTYKTAYYKTKPNFSQFFLYHWLLHRCFFSILITALANFEKLIRFHWQSFIVYKNGDNLKMLIQVFCQKCIDSNVFLAFLTLLKPKMFFVGQSLWPT